MSRFTKQQRDIALGTVGPTREFLEEIERQSAHANAHADELRRSRDESLARLAAYEAIVEQIVSAVPVGDARDLLEDVAPGLAAEIERAGERARAAFENYRDAIGKAGWS